MSVWYINPSKESRAREAVRLVRGGLPIPESLKGSAALKAATQVIGSGVKDEEDAVLKVYKMLGGAATESKEEPKPLKREKDLRKRG